MIVYTNSFTLARGPVFGANYSGQHIVLLDELDMVIVTAADPFWQQHDDESWKHESAVIKLVGKFINSLPTE